MNAVRPTHLLLLVPAMAVVALLALGIVTLLGFAFTNGGQYVRDVLTRDDYRALLLFTHQVALIVTVTCTLLAYPVAAFIARAQRFRTTLLLLVVMPWLVSIVVRTYGWTVLLGRRGAVNGLLQYLELIDRPLPLLFNSFSIVLGMVHVLLPFMILSILAVLAQIPAAMTEAAASLGCGPLRGFIRVTLPLSLPGILSGAILVYLGCVGAVVTPLLLGGLSEKMVGTQIYTDMLTFFDFPKAAAMAFVLVITALAVVLPVLAIERTVIHRLADRRRPA
jgi:putative spermidine/putrescine transport system permease protein